MTKIVPIIAIAVIISMFNMLIPLNSSASTFWRKMSATSKYQLKEVNGEKKNAAICIGCRGEGKVFLCDWGGTVTNGQSCIGEMDTHNGHEIIRWSKGGCTVAQQDPQGKFPQSSYLVERIGNDTMKFTVYYAGKYRDMATYSKESRWPKNPKCAP
jgi:hypothetical protein